MLRRLPLLLAASAVLFALLLGIAVWQCFSGPKIQHMPAQSLADALPPESTADFTAARPVIDELRHLHGSVLEGTSLATPAEGAPTGNSYVELLRHEARRLDDIAADYEDQHDYERADRTRGEAESLRQLAREKAEPLIRFGGIGDTTVNR